jgi:hypothetical protein
MEEWSDGILEYLFNHSAIRIPCLREAASAKAGEIRNLCI